MRGTASTAIGPGRAVTFPAGAERVDVRGKTIIPGLIDVHAHVNGEDDGILAEQSWPLVAEPGLRRHHGARSLERHRNRVREQRAGARRPEAAPRLFSTGTILYGAETPFKAVVDNYDDALAHLRRLKAAGAFSVKSYNQQRRDARQMILKAARELQMMVVPEGGSLFYYN